MLLAMSPGRLAITQNVHLIVNRLIQLELYKVYTYTYNTCNTINAHVHVKFVSYMVNSRKEFL